MRTIGSTNTITLAFEIKLNRTCYKPLEQIYFCRIISTIQLSVFAESGTETIYRFKSYTKSDVQTIHSSSFQFHLYFISIIPRFGNLHTLGRENIFESAFMPKRHPKEKKQLKNLISRIFSPYGMYLIYYRYYVSLYLTLSFITKWNTKKKTFLTQF